MNAVLPHRKWEIQDDGFKTRSLNASADDRQDRNIVLTVLGV